MRGGVSIYTPMAIHSFDVSVLLVNITTEGMSRAYVGGKSLLLVYCFGQHI